MCREGGLIARALSIQTKRPVNDPHGGPRGSSKSQQVPQEGGRGFDMWWAQAVGVFLSSRAGVAAGFRYQDPHPHRPRAHLAYRRPPIPDPPQWCPTPRGGVPYAYYCQWVLPRHHECRSLALASRRGLLDVLGCATRSRSNVASSRVV